MAAAPKANPPIRTLLGPGPSPVHPRVLEALSHPTIGVREGFCSACLPLPTDHHEWGAHTGCRG